MTPELFKLLENLLASEAIGTLHLGTGGRKRRIFLSGKEVHLLDAGRQCRFVPSPVILKNERISQQILEQALEVLRREPQGALKILQPLGFLAPAERRQLQRVELLEEMLDLFEQHAQFVFEAEAVPAELLTPSNKTPGIPFDNLLDCMRVRIREEEGIASSLPSDAEVLVLSEAGEQAIASGSHWSFQEVTRLIDGHRSLREIVQDSMFFPHLTRQIIASGLLQGWIRKTLFHELLEIDAALLPPHAAREMIPQFQAAIEVAFDELPLRKNLASFYLRGGLVDEAVAEFLLVGNLLRTRQDYLGAVHYYREALRWEPQSEPARESLVALFLQAAERAGSENSLPTALGFLYEALRYRPTDLSLFVRAVDLCRGNHTRIAQLLPELLKRLVKQGGRELELEFLGQLAAKHRKSVYLRSRWINQLLDAGRTQQAIEEMETLAAELGATGRTDEAAALHRKVSLLAPERRPSVERRQSSERRTSRRRRAPRRIRMLRVVAAALILVGLWHLWAYQGYAALRQRAHAFELRAKPPAGTPQFHAYRQEAERLSDELHAFSSRHFFSLYGVLGRRTAFAVTERADALEREWTENLAALEKRALDFEKLNEFTEAIEVYRQLASLGGDSEWSERSRERVRELENYEQAAAELLAAGRRAFEAGDHPGSFASMHRLIHEFPRSAASRQAALPVRLHVQPVGATVREGSQLLGQAPLLLRLQPARTLRLEISAPGYKPRFLRIEDPASCDIHVQLTK